MTTGWMLMAARRKNRKKCKSPNNVRGCATANTCRSMETGRERALEAMLASVNPFAARGESLDRVISKVLDAVSTVFPLNSGLYRALYGGLAELCRRVREAGEGSSVGHDPDLWKKCLFESQLEIEALRLLRADAVVEACKTSEALGTQVKEDVIELRERETSKSVRDRLSEAPHVSRG
jgi:proteasome component ECM29